MPRGNDGGSKAKRAGTRPTITAPRGTIRPHKGFDEEAALAQAKILRTALQKPTNTNAIIGVLTKHTLEERKYVEDVYNAQHSPSLQEALRHEFSANLRETLLALLQWPNQYLAGWVQRALRGARTDQKTLFEVLCGRAPADLQDLVRAYRRLHGHSLEADLRTALSGDTHDLALALVRRQGNTAAPAGEDGARALAGRLAQAAEARDAAVFTEALSGASPALLSRAIELFPGANGGRGLEEAVRAAFGGDLRAVLLTLVQCSADRPAYFAERLYRAMRGLGTDDGALIRILVTRSEADLENVKEAYQRRYGKSLADAVEDDTSGYFWRCLKAIIKP